MLLQLATSYCQLVTVSELSFAHPAEQRFAEIRLEDVNFSWRFLKMDLRQTSIPAPEVRLLSTIIGDGKRLAA